MPWSEAHRPWEAPRRRWFMFMRWNDLLFAHWPVEPAVLRPLIPAALELDLFDGRAWLAVTPFWMSGVRVHATPAVPYLSRSPEINLRTYVTIGGRPGVWFFSLDLARVLAVWGARALYCLPYYAAEMRVDFAGDRIDYHSRRTHAGAAPAQFEGSYQPAGPVFRARPGSLEHFLAERYCLYSADRTGRIWRGEIHHLPWPLQPAAGEIRINTMARPLGLELAGEPLLHYSRALDVVAWLPQRVV